MLGTSQDEGTLEGVRGIPLAYRIWPPHAERKRTLVVVHGLSEHAGRYAHVAAAANARGWRLLGADLRGHGRSGGRRGHVVRFCDFVEDLRRVLGHVRAAHPGPVALLGHSMGGLICLLALTETEEPGVAGVVLSSPLLGLAVPVPRFKALAARWLAGPAPWVSFRTGLTPQACRDPVRVAAAAADPLMGRRISARLFVEMQAALARAMTLAPRLTVPALFLQAGDDRLVNAAASRRYFERAGSADKTWRLYEGFSHEIFNEPNGELPLREMLDWLDQRVPASPGEAP